MNLWLHLPLTFACGAAYESGCVLWVHYSESNQKGKAVVPSMFNAIMTIIGVENFLINMPLKIAYVLGFGVGTYIAIALKERLGAKFSS